ncbi:MAG: hypothetical protein LBT94_10185 [Prevotellaceae bacterium]|jgi:hypothetical protein|nr:hypothetical protein [Prevotellaceae bacterium]
MRINEEFNRKLLVEGNDDQHVIWALCKRSGIPKTFDVVDCEGIDKLFEVVPVRFKQSEIQAIGIIVDADTEIGRRWVAVKNLLSQQGFAPPDDLPPTGLILSNESGVKAGVWIMPDNNLNGMLEDFISFLVPPDDELLPIADATLAAIESQHLNKYALIHKSKAKIQTWLAWQDNPGAPMGLSITKRYLTTDEETCQRLIGWLRALFCEPELS